MTDPGPDFGRQYAAQVLLDPAVNGAGNVQDALDALGDAGMIVNLQTNGDALLSQLNATFPVNLDPTSILGTPWGFGTIPIPSRTLGAAGVIMGETVLRYPDFLAPAGGAIVASLYITNPAGTNTATIDLDVLATTIAGQNFGGAQALDLGTHPPTFVGADLAVDSGNLITTAGGIYGGCVMFGLQGN